MGQRAAHWLADLDLAWRTARQFRVHFHSCDCHNPSNGRTPSQKCIHEYTILSNDSLNKALNANLLI